MNRYPLWKYVTVAVALLFGLVYTLPNFFGESPAVQVSSAKATLKVDDKTRERVASTLQTAGIESSGIFLDSNGVKVRLLNADTQLQAKGPARKAVQPGRRRPAVRRRPESAVEFAAVADQPARLPMYLGLDLRGGVHFLLQVDMKGALTKRLDAISGDLRSLLRDKTVRHAGITREGERVVIRFRDNETRNKARIALEDNQSDLLLADQGEGDDLRLVATLKPEAIKRIQEFAIKQNMTTLHNRINELGVAEPVIAQQGADRIVVQLPGCRTRPRPRTFSAAPRRWKSAWSTTPPAPIEAAQAGQAPFGTELYVERGGMPLLVKKQVVLTGDRLTDAQPGFDNQTHRTRRPPDARLGRGAHLQGHHARQRRQADGHRADRKGQGRSGHGAGHPGRDRRRSRPDFRPHEHHGSQRHGAAAARRFARRTDGDHRGTGHRPEPGRREHQEGLPLDDVGLCRDCRVHDRLLHALRSGLGDRPGRQPALPGRPALLAAGDADLPGIAAIALTLGMAIDANVLINERIREELRNGSTPQAAIHTGYERAFGTILDSNITTLIAGIALLIFGSGPVRGFAVVHCLGILTSLFSAVVVSRAMINLIYGRRRKVESLAIGQVWKPGNTTPATK
jgi:preprotein translocase subunit SecD